MGRKLTNLQMTVLSERVTDLLEEAAKAKNQAILESEEYTTFEDTYSDPYVDVLRPLAEKARIIEDKRSDLRAAEEEIELLARQAKTQYTCEVVERWHTVRPVNELQQYLQRKKASIFEDSLFNREKTLRRVQADILLSDLENPEELVKSLVEKLK